MQKKNKLVGTICAAQTTAMLIISEVTAVEKQTAHTGQIQRLK